MTHPYKDILIAIANGEQIQWQTSHDEWKDEDDKALSDIALAEYAPDRYRIKPKTININGYEVPEPVREPLSNGSKYWTTVICKYQRDFYTWENDETDRRWLKLGIIHKTEDAAAIHREALLSFTKLKESK